MTPPNVNKSAQSPDAETCKCKQATAYGITARKPFSRNSVSQFTLTEVALSVSIGNSVSGAPGASTILLNSSNLRYIEGNHLENT